MKKQFIKTFDSLNYIFYKSYLKKNNIDESKLLILATIPRSGTHLIKFLFSNYIKLLACKTQSEPVSPDEMNNFFPNNYQFMYKQYDYEDLKIKIKQFLNNSNLDDIGIQNKNYKKNKLNKNKNKK